MQKSLGLIETQGLLGGVTAADAAVKSANVELIGYELTKGGGWTTVKTWGPSRPPWTPPRSRRARCAGW